MFVILQDKTICLTRGDIANIVVSAHMQNRQPYIFKPGDIVRFKVFKKRDCSNIIIQKDVEVTKETPAVSIGLLQNDTKIGQIINRPVDYWYEVEVNPETAPQTIIGYDEMGEKIFRLYPEGGQLVNE